jgi:hypothetical protein
MENANKELELMSVEEKHNTEHQSEKERLKKEYVRRPRLILNTKLLAKIKCKQLDHWQYQY